MTGADEKRLWGRFWGAIFPRPNALAVSVFLHVAALAAIILIRHTGHPHIQAEAYTVVPIPPSPIYMTQTNSGGGIHGASSSHVKRRSSFKPSRFAEATEIIDPGQTMEEQAKRWTSTLTKSLDFHGIYLNHVYQLAVQQSGDLPFISPDELPPHYQQYVIIEITIDTKGQAAAVRVVAGEVDTKIQEKLLAAVRKFRYVPAMRDGLAIPSQRDIVIHVPS